MKVSPFLVLGVLFLAGCATEIPKPPLPPIEIAFDEKYLDQFDKLPQPRFEAVPQVAPEVRSKRVPGKAVVTFTIGMDGKVNDVSLVSSTQEEYGRAALAAAPKNLYHPAQSNGKSVPCKVQFSYTFAYEAK